MNRLNRQQQSVQQWTRFHAFALTGSLLVTVFLRDPAVFAIVGLISFGYFIWSHWQVENHSGRFSFFLILANWVTAFRLALVSIIALTFSWWSPLWLGLAGLLILILDKVDGTLAQKFESATSVGAQFDQETDAFFISIYALILYLDGYLGLWIIVLGMLRYLNIIALFLLNQQHKKEPRLSIARWIAGLVMASLLLPFVSSRAIYSPLAILAVVSLVISFGITFTTHITQVEE